MEIERLPQKEVCSDAAHVARGLRTQPMIGAVRLLSDHSFYDFSRRMSLVRIQDPERGL
jgi:hypothetical protein